VATLDALSGKQRRARLDAIRNACRAFIAGPLVEQFRQIAAAAMPGNRFLLESDPDDQDGRSLLFWYPTAMQDEDGYIRSAVKIEAGAKLALDPNVATGVTPYVAADLLDLNLTVGNVTTVRPERTFWDKIIILHGLRQWHEHRGELRHGGQRVSRHYYDVHQLMKAAMANVWTSDLVLANDCAQHAKLFFGSANLGLDAARPGAFTLSPDATMRSALAKDYDAMTAMVFGAPPEFDDVLASVREVESIINGPAKSVGG
jgi:hypothetical protein